ncbi:MAG: hypothetical protein A2751_05245 [Candidatus Doudnabacteria bacterium RIFCSPHIGHO2_01_FULL_46_14]|uniref:alanine--tRNA ligase n=1 Tax=Candidatus Doudnabacteria bacterium RIFCSPHIGHO2_01_FULL_46_14 TaxID=1817824 RepID=A0A1F5NNZ8_9BACT|nr:MAG: hypothetical protein A2751_05245 [Candidatus Doudnabacteria bacterium RIFCSPHIGHO2_01_FULL_46_14]
MNSNELRRKFINFFKSKGHAVVPSSSLVPDDPSVLLTTAGMQQFKKYFTGELDAQKDFGSKNTTSIQKSFRTSDIDEVGDDTHDTFFEMLGNFSFGGYFKKEAIEYAHDFLTRELGLEIDYVTVFEGDKEVPADTESEEIWRSLGVINIKRLGRADNFWGPTGVEGPCGPTTEIFMKNLKSEVWNLVFNQYYLHPDGFLEKLKTPGADTGMGLERLATVAQKKRNIFETDLFAPLLALIDEGKPERVKRIIADHGRAVSFLISDGVIPSNKGAGYVLRRLMRRMIVHGTEFEKLFAKVVEIYGETYKELNLKQILQEFEKENSKFQKTLKSGLRELGKLEKIDAASGFKLYETYGLPFEILKDAEISGDKAKGLNREDFEKEFAKHQEKSRAGAEKKFGGHGLLLDTGELKAVDERELKIVTRLHTATHLMQAALREVLGPEVKQNGSDITAERTRFDFFFSRKVTPEEIKKVEDLVNKKIAEDLPVSFVELPLEEAKLTGALYFSAQGRSASGGKAKYGSKVKVYYIGKDLETAWSREFCGGPHVSHTSEVGKFKILKEESASSGIRRIRAIVE